MWVGNTAQAPRQGALWATAHGLIQLFRRIEVRHPYFFNIFLDWVMIFKLKLIFICKTGPCGSGALSLGEVALELIQMFDYSNGQYGAHFQ